MEIWYVHFFVLEPSQNKKPRFRKDYFEFFGNEIVRQAIYDFTKTVPRLEQ